ncbi:MAG TPA: hypothetical protein ENJ91_01955 [Rhodobacteraceae bacterium]|nr:hypothetical protein [Paracoccaceae bacterium]
MFRRTAYFLSLLTVLFLAACGKYSAGGPPTPSDQQIAELATAIQALGPDVDPEEAQRAARIAFTYPLQLAKEYQITDPPLIHNIKVNQGLRPRGLCWHWAEDMEKRLAQEHFKTLDLHRAIGNSEVALRIDHSTTIISAKGDGMYDGLVLDPWRWGGRLFWGDPKLDTKYQWLPQQQVLAKRLKQRLAKLKPAG